jgi:hypothetical protein
VAASHAGVVHSAASIDGGFRAGLLVAGGIGAVATITAMWFPKRQTRVGDVGVPPEVTFHRVSAPVQVSAPPVAA